ncbi:MAG TPA: hypothetical protein PK254_00635, partial [Methanolinea sp.]|nr:hypothetical protein [Methanolinea sp.]
YYYRQGDEKYPTTTGLSGMYVSDILIYPINITETAPPDSKTLSTTSPKETSFSHFTILYALAVCGFTGYISKRRKK